MRQAAGSTMPATSRDDMRPPGDRRRPRGSPLVEQTTRCESIGRIKAQLKEDPMHRLDQLRAMLCNVFHAARCVACQGVRSHAVADRARWRVLHHGRVEGGSPAALVIAGELKVEALVRHTDSDAPDARPRVEVGANDMESSISPRKPGEAECCSQELSALVEHALVECACDQLECLVRAHQHCLGNLCASFLWRC